MIKIRKFKEEWVDGLEVKPNEYTGKSYYEIFRNPSKSELNEACSTDFRRGIVLKNGDFYIVSESCNIIHIDLVRILKKAGIISDRYVETWWSNKDKDSLNEFFGIVETMTKFSFAQSLSYVYKVIEEAPEILNEYRLSFKKKNPYYYMNLDNTKVYDY